jgi:D-beta-D-heptose 7-phosphate kinase / D-beta-D-heptose 1-phosphate adenosyltransferase
MKNILVIGDLILDTYISGIINKISPENHCPVFELANSKKNFYLGGAANVAINLSLLENNVFLIGKIGKDKNGDIIKNLLKKKINFLPIVSSNFKTINKLRYVTDYGHVLRVDDENLKTNKRSFKLDFIKKRLNQISFDAIYVSDYNKGFIDSSIIKFIRSLKQKKTLLFVDTKNYNLNLYRNFDFIKPNKPFIESLINKKINLLQNKKDITQLRLLIKKFALKNMIITMGSKGALYLNNKKKFFSKAKKVEFYNLSGAGDVFGSVFISNFLINNDEKKSLDLANLKTSEAIQKPGTVSLIKNTKKEIFYFKTDKISIKKKLNEVIGDVVFSNGCFDLFHPGHLSLLNFARQKGDFLIIGLNSDKSVKKLKGKNRPLIDEINRANLLLNINVVDMVVVFDENTPYQLIKFIKPNILVKGKDYKIKEVIGYDIIKKWGGKVYLAPLIRNFSTTNLLKKL